MHFNLQQKDSKKMIRLKHTIILFQNWNDSQWKKKKVARDDIFAEKLFKLN
jgi:hypothetical protein